MLSFPEREESTTVPTKGWIIGPSFRRICELGKRTTFIIGKGASKKKFPTVPKW